MQAIYKGYGKEGVPQPDLLGDKNFTVRHCMILPEALWMVVKFGGSVERAEWGG